MIKRGSLPKSLSSGLSDEEKQYLGIKSGSIRVDKIIHSQKLSIQDTKRVFDFYMKSP